MPRVEPFGASTAQPVTSNEPEAVGLTGDQLPAFCRITDLLRRGQPVIKMTGFAGTGKTWLLAKLAAWASRQRMKVTVAAPTHKACGVIADRMAEGGAVPEVRTIHSLLGLLLAPDFENDTGGRILTANPLSTKQVTGGLVICDEASMIGSVLKDHIDRRSRQGGQAVGWLFIGDPAQLPPVGEDTSEMLVNPDAHLRTVLRQRKESETLALATRIRQGDLSLRHRAGLDVTEVGSITDLVEAALPRFRSEACRADPSHARILSFRNDRREAINLALRQILVGADLPFIKDEWLVMHSGFCPETSELNRLAEHAKQFQRGQPEFSSSWRTFFEAKEEIEDRGTAPPSLHVSQEVRVFEAWEDIVPCTGHHFPVWTLTVKDQEDELHQLPVLKPECREEHRQAMATESAAALEHRAAMDALPEDRQGEHDDEWRDLDKQRRRRWGAYFTLESTFASVDYAYAMTTHKAQGSTFDHVFVDAGDLMTSGGMRQRILYTAVTRPSETLTFCR